MSPLIAPPTEPTRENLRLNLQERTFDGHVSIAQFSRGERFSREAFIDKLLDEEIAAGSPFPLELALVRAYQTAFQYAGESTEAFLGHLRFGVWASHMVGTREVEYADLARALGHVMARKDVRRAIIEEAGGRGGRLVEWAGFAFSQVDPTGLDPQDRSLQPSDLLPMLFEMGNSLYGRPCEPVLDYAAGNLDDDKPASERTTLLPLMVGRSWNRDVLAQLRVDHPLPLVMAFGARGATFGLSVVHVGRHGAFAQSEMPLVTNVRPLGGRVAADTDIWILAEYQPPVFNTAFAGVSE